MAYGFDLQHPPHHPSSSGGQLGAGCRRLPPLVQGHFSAHLPQGEAGVAALDMVMLAAQGNRAARPEEAGSAYV